MPIMGSLVMDPSTKMFSAQICGNCSQPRSTAEQKAAVPERWQLHFSLVVNFNHRCRKPTAKSVFPAPQSVALSVSQRRWLYSLNVTYCLGRWAKLVSLQKCQTSHKQRSRSVKDGRGKEEKKTKKMRQLKEKTHNWTKKKFCQNLKWGEKKHRWRQTWANAGMKWVWELKLNSVK